VVISPEVRPVEACVFELDGVGQADGWLIPSPVTEA